jgi:hypothetical protein
MNRQKTLRVRLVSMYTPNSSEDKTQILKQLLCFQSLEIFEVRFSWDIGSTASLMKSRPFDLEGVKGQAIERTSEEV